MYIQVILERSNGSVKSHLKNFYVYKFKYDGKFNGAIIIFISIKIFNQKVNLHKKDPPMRADSQTSASRMA